MSRSPQSLPIDAVLPEIVASLETAQNLVLTAPTGAGKTTRVPPALLRAGLADGGRIVMLEPRRVAARAAARRMAAEFGCRVGGTVGYRVRFETFAGPETKILVCTEGVLVRMLQRDPFLEGVALVVFDEFHERSLDLDLALAMSRKVQLEVRDDLKLLVMSATLDRTAVVRFLGNCPAVTSEGRLFPVEVHYSRLDERRSLEERTSALIERACAETDGDVLCFLPGVREILRTGRLVERALPSCAVLPLYGALKAAEQDRALEPIQARKVVLATNVAESSVTIPGVSTVVDTGLARTMRYDPASGLDRLETGRISADSAEQRKGRAGRERPGWCYRLWSISEQHALKTSQTPEVARVDLVGPVLELICWGERDVASFGWFEAPPAGAIKRALSLLTSLGAVHNGGVTNIGRQLVNLPLHPRLGRVLLEARRSGVGDSGALAVALLSDVWKPRWDDEARWVGESDVLERVREYKKAPKAARRSVTQAYRQLKQKRDPKREPNDTQPGDDALLKAIAVGFVDRLARRRGPGDPRAVMRGGHGVRLHKSSVVQSADLFVCVSMWPGRRGQHNEASVIQASVMDPSWLDESLVTVHEQLAFDHSSARVVARQERRVGDLVISESTARLTDMEAASAILAAAAKERLEDALGLTAPEHVTLLARLSMLSEHCPELGLPDVSNTALASRLPLFCQGKHSFKTLRRSWAEIMLGELSRTQQLALDRDAPERIEVPSGSRVKLVYKRGKAPVLAARIQELFGMAQTPRIARGRVVVVMHLLAPNMRPQQITKDLASFWASTYADVRKELRRRYPKHSWPDDPTTATPMRGAKRRRS